MIALRAPLFAGIAMAASFGAASHAQTQTTALLNARVIDGRGQVLNRATIVIRDGNIVAYGQPAERRRVRQSY